MMKKHNHAAQSGFTLLEMSVILTAVMMLIGTYLSFYRPQQVTERTVETRQRIDRVLNAVSAFAFANGRLPCSTFPTNNPTNGTAKGAGCGGVSVDMGIVPYQTLNLSQDDVKDGFGNYMTYIVSGNATTTDGFAIDNLASSKFCTASTPSNIPVIRNGAAVSNADRPYVVVISHGPDGIGAYDMRNSNAGLRGNAYGSMGQLGTNEAANAVTGAATDPIYMDSFSTPGDLALSYNPQSGTRHFDDIIGMMTGPQISARLSLDGCH